MKKTILVIAAVALLASPAMAVDWNFYGNARVATFYVSNDDADSLFAPDPGGLAATDQPIGIDDDGVQWELADNSRIGANVKAENISGRFELALRSANSHDDTVSTRLLYGDWDFGAAKLRVGKAYTPTTQFISGQAYAEDLGLLGIGTNYGRRVPGLQLMFGGFTIALLEPNTTDGDAYGTFIGGDVDAYLPKIEASYGMSFDTWNFTVMGGYQHVEVEDVGPDTEDIDVDSWIVGGDVGFNFGPAYVKAAGSYGENWTNARWSDLGFVNDVFAGAIWDGDDDTEDSDNWQASLVGGFKFTDQVTFEVGGGYREASTDISGAEDDAAWCLYGQTVISLAPNVFLIPEVGYFDYEDGVDDEDAGSSFYLGAKWQINF